MKRTVIFILILTLLFPAFRTYGKAVSTYDVLTQMDMELINRFKDGGLEDELIIDFMNAMDEEVAKLQHAEPRAVLEKFFIYILVDVISRDEFIDVLVTLDIFFSEEIEYILENYEVPPSFEIFFLTVISEWMIIENPPPSGGSSWDNVDIYEMPAPLPEIEPEAVEIPIFTDLDEFEWAKPFIHHLYKAGYVNGYADMTFRPGDTITRAELTKIAVSCFLNQKYKEKASLFNDVNEGDWFYDYLMTAEYFSLFGGIYSDNFSPYTPITRQELCAVLYRSVRRIDKDLPRIVPAYDFVDVTEFSNYAYDAINELQRAGVIEGVGESRFDPKGTATRAEASKMISILVQLR